MTNFISRSVNAYVKEDLAKHLKYIGIGIISFTVAFIAVILINLKK